MVRRLVAAAGQAGQEPGQPRHDREHPDPLAVAAAIFGLEVAEGKERGRSIDQVAPAQSPDFLGTAERQPQRQEDGAQLGWTISPQ